VARLTLRRLLRRWRSGPWKVGSIVASADAIPDTIDKHRTVVVSDQEFRKWVAFECPCGRGHRIMLNLDRSRYPRWTITTDAPLTIRPSVDTTNADTRCHFIIERGHVYWVPNVFESNFRRMTNGVDRV
jgi:hypothetical protein